MKNYKLPLITILSVISISGFTQVGIGTTSPDEVLDIESSDALKTAIDINNTSTGDPLIHFQISGTSIFSIGIDNSDANKFKIGTTAVSTGTAITIDANGDVGINDTDPAYKLEVNGDINMVNSTDVYRIGAVHVLSKPNTQNIYVGEGAGNANNASGTDNTFVGYNSGYTNSSADNNVYLGSEAGYSTTSGGTNTAMGYQSGYSNSTGTGNIFIGYQAGYNETGSDKLYIDNSNTTTPLIYADFATDEVTINGSLVINEQSADKDFRVESDNNTHMLFLDASTEQVIIGSENSFTLGSTVKTFQVSGTDASAGLGITRHSTDASEANISFGKARGTEAAPIIVSNGDVLGSLRFYGYDGSDYVSEGAAIEAAIYGTPGANDVPTKLSFKTTADGSASATTRMTILPNGFIGIGQTAPTTQLFVEAAGATVATFNRTTSNGTLIDFQQAGTSEGSITFNGTDVLYNAFTGSHFGFSKKSFERGYLVSLNGKNENYHGNENSEILYGISYTIKENDPNVLGSYAGVLEPSQKHDLNNPHQIMAVGNGSMWITNKGENLEIGDYLISSSVKGCAMKDPQSDEVSYIVARAAENINWNEVEADEDGGKKIIISVFYESFKKYNHRAKLELLQKELEALKLLINN